jgi:uncharacterized membrane protein
VIDAPIQLLAVFLGLVSLAVWLDSSYAWGRKISAVVMILFLAGLVSNFGLITRRSPFYEEVTGFTVPFAVCLILFTVNLEDLKRSGKPLLVAFAVACIGTVIGVLAAGFLLQPQLARILGAESWKLAGPFTGTYVGGSLNFFAMWEGLEIGRPDLFAAANAVDNITILPMFALWIAIPGWLGHRYPMARFWGTPSRESGSAERVAEPPALRVLDLTVLAFVAVVIMVLSGLIKARLIVHVMPSLPTILIVTTLALVMAQLPFMKRLQGAFELGNFSFYLFFCAVGAMIDVQKAVVLSPILFIYVMVMIAVHFVTVYGFGRLLRLDIRMLTIASAAAKTGPPIVVAVANVHGWKSLLLPGVAMGLLGYAVGNYLGFAAAYLMKALLGQ